MHTHFLKRYFDEMMEMDDSMQGSSQSKNESGRG